METLTDLLFELSNDDRLKILLELEKGQKNLTRMAKDLDFTAQGTSRNVARLVQTSLISRNPEGEYDLTTYGRIALKLLGSYRFISREKDYFLSHRTDSIPFSLISRFGELTHHDKVGEILDVVSNIEREIKEAEEFEWYISPGRMISNRNLDMATEALDRGVKIRAIEPTHYTPSEQALKEAPKEILSASEKHWRLGNIEIRYLDRVEVRLYMTEKEVAILALPRLDGEVDTLGFHSKDKDFIAWCTDLFEYYWVRAKQETWFWTQGREHL